MQTEKTRVLDLILVPGLITLGVTVLRAVGELQNWPSVLFSRAPGGGGAIVGIAWLAFIFAIYFAVKLHRAGDVLPHSGKAIGLTLLALVLFIASGFLPFLGAGGQNVFRLSLLGALGGLGAVVALLVMRPAWPAYWKVMLAYALVARIPVIIVYYLAIRGNWNTHYDAVPPGTVIEGPRFVLLGLLPQLFLWVPWTVIFCGLFGIVTAAVMRRSRRVAAAA